MDFIPTPGSVPKRRAKKHPLAPKRPMSAFLKYSISRRKAVKADNPDMNNTDISRLLGEMWRNASEDDKRPYKENELKESKIYLLSIHHHFFMQISSYLIFYNFFLGNQYKKEMKRWRLIQQKKETDKALNESNRAKSEEACSKMSMEPERLNEDPLKSRNNKPQPPFHQSSRHWTHGGNDFVADRNITRQSITHGRVKSPHHFDNPSEPFKDFHHFQATPYNYGGNDYVGDVHNRQYEHPPRERPPANHRPQYYYDEARYQPNHDGRVGESMPPFEEKTGTCIYRLFMISFCFCSSCIMS